MNDGKGKAKAITPSPVDISDMEDEALDWGKDHSDEEFEFNKISDMNNMRDLTPMAWERKDKHYNAYYNGIAPSVFFSIDHIGTNLLSNQGWLSYRLNRSVDSSICINGRVTIDTPVCNIICECLSSNCVECKKKHKSIKTNKIVFIADSGTSATFMYDINDFSKYKKLLFPSEAHTANEGKPLKIVGKGTIFMRHEVCTGLWINIQMYPVFHIPGLSG